MEFSDRLKKLPPYLFAEIDKAKRQAKAEGKDIIDLGIGDPDQPTPRHIIDELYKAAQDPANHKYALDAGLPRLREVIAKWYQERFGVALDPLTEILPLIGSKEGIAHMPLAFINPGDVSLVPDPCYPPYKSGTIFAGGEPYLMPLLAANNFLPDFDLIDSQVLDRAKMLYLNYPNNPTSAIATIDFFNQVVDFSRENNLIVCHDAAYSEMSYDDYNPISFLQAQGAKDAGVEFHSLSKTYNMTGWRVAFAVGNSKLIAGLAKVKSNIDSGIFQAVQAAGIMALEGPQDYVLEMKQMYQERRDVLVDGLNNLGWKTAKPKATFYVWIPVPPGYTSAELVKLLLEKTNIITTPGIGFGPNGEGYIRMTLTVPKKRLEEAVQRIKNLKF